MAAIANRPARSGYESGRTETWSTPAGEATASRWRLGMRNASRSVPRLIVTSLAAALLILPIAEGTQNAEAGKKSKSKTISRAFSDAGAIDIADHDVGEPYQSTLQVDAFKKYAKAKIIDVNLTLRGFSHTRPDDVEVFLVAPDGRNAILMSDRGGSDDADELTLTFDDQAAAPIPDAGPLVSGSFQPNNTGVGDEFPSPAPEPSGSEELSVFNGDDPDGKWKLFILDDAGEGGSGVIADGWRLEIEAKVKKNKR